MPQTDAWTAAFVHTAVRDSGFKLRESALLVEGLKVVPAIGSRRR
jgi:hypothetical protein